MTGPMDAMVGDFWEMIIQENTSIIIMLTNVVEHGVVCLTSSYMYLFKVCVYTVMFFYHFIKGRQFLLLLICLPTCKNLLKYEPTLRGKS